VKIRDEGTLSVMSFVEILLVGSEGISSNKTFAIHYDK
jgi:hypothetical protein